MSQRGLFLGTGLAGALLVTLAACADMNGNKGLPVETLRAGSHCGTTREEPRLRLITDREQLQELRQAMRGHVVGDDDNDRVTSPDLDDNVAVLIEMGQRPTGGYGLELREPHAVLANGTVTVPINWREPAEDAVVTQALTSPCLLLTLPRREFETIKAVDQHGHTRARN